MKVGRYLLTLAVLMFCGMIFADDDASETEKPWVLETFGKELTRASGKKFGTEEVLKDKLVLVCFSSLKIESTGHVFAPTLIQFYKKTASNAGLEVVFVSYDNTAKACMKKFSMPWYSIPFDSPEAAALRKSFGGTRLVPILIVFDRTGKLLSRRARFDVILLGTQAVAAWQSKDYKPKTFTDFQESRIKSKEKKTVRRRRK